LAKQEAISGHYSKENYTPFKRAQQS
jgi:hypothetical protein